MKRMVWKCCFLLAMVFSASPIPTRATPPPYDASPQSAVHEKLTQLDQRVTAAQSAGDNAWMLVSAALVLMMTGPGLALFYGGLVRRKNTLAIMMQSFMLMAIISVLWALVGYSLCFGGNGPGVGRRVQAVPRRVGAPAHADYSGTIAHAPILVDQRAVGDINPAPVT